jgi:hypothetical protein
MKKNVMGETCDKYGRQEKCVQDFDGETWVNESYAWMGGCIKGDFQEVGWGDMDWINLSQDRDSWRALLNDVMSIRVQ